MAAEDARLGTGYVEIRPDFSRFQEELGRRLTQTLTPAFKKAGRNASRSMASGVDQGGLGRALAPLLRRVEKTGDQAGKTLAAKVGRGATRAKGDMFGLADAVHEVEKRSRAASGTARTLDNDMFGIARAAKASGKSILSARTQLHDWHARAGAAEKVASSLGSRLRGLGYEFGTVARGIRTSAGGFSGFDGVMARVNRSAQFFRNIMRTLRWPAMISAVGLAAQGLSALAAAAVATASALGPLGGTLIALPAAAIAAAQAFGVLKLATAGIGGALQAGFKAQIRGGEQAAQTMRRQEDAAERVADAHRNLTQVERQARFAEEDLTKAREDARRVLQDMRLEAEGAGDSEEEAVLRLRQARQDLAETLREPGTTSLDVSFAELGVDQARRDLERTRIDARRARDDYAKARKKGVEGMPEVVAAKRAEADANRAVNEAENDLTKAVRDSTTAMEKQGSAASAFQEKMAMLPPAAQKFVRVLLSLKPRFDELRQVAAKGFFPGAEEGLRRIMGRFGVVRRIVGGTASELGKIAAKAGRQFSSIGWAKDLGRLGRFNTRVIGRMGDSALNLADAFRHVLISARPFLSWLSKGVEHFTEWIDSEAEAGRKTGALARFFDRTRNVMELLKPILKGVGGALLNIGEAARPLGNEILDSLGKAAEGWREWTASTKGQDRLKQHFEETKPAIFEMGRLIRDAGKAFLELGKQQGVTTLLRLVRTELIPALRDGTGAVTGWASGFIKQFGALRKEGVPTFDAFIQVIADHAGQAGWKISKALVNAFLNSSILGKLAIAGWLLARFGGLKAFASIGARAGGRFGKAMVEKIIAWFAGTETGAGLLGWFQDAVGPGGRLGKAARVGGSKLGRLFSRSLMVGAVAGLAAMAPMIGEALNKYVVKPGQSWIEDKLGAVGSAITSAQTFIGKNFPDIGAQGAVIRKAFGGNLPGEVPPPKTDAAENALERFSKAVERSGERAKKGLRRQLDQLPGIAERSSKGIYRQTVPRLEALANEGGKKGRAFASRVGGSFGRLSGAVKGALSNIEINVGNALKGLNLGKAPHFNLKRLIQSLPELPPLNRQKGGPVPTFATGGLASVVPGASTGDRHLLSLNGKPVAKVESREGIFVGNRNLMGALQAANEAVPRFQEGGFLGDLQHLRRGGLAEPQIVGPGGGLHQLGQQAIKKVYEGAKDFLAKHRPKLGGYSSGGKGSVVERMGRILLGRGLDLEASAGIIGNSYQESDWDPTAMEPGTDNGGLFGFTAGEKSMNALRTFAARLKKPWQDVGTQVSFMLTTLSGGLKTRLNAASTIAETTALFMNEWERPNAALANLPRRIAGAGMALKILKHLQPAGRQKGMLRGGLLGLAQGGMVDPRWDPGSEVIASSIAQLVGAYAKRYDADITAGYDPGGGHVSPGHNVTGTATDVVPRDGNWDGAYAKGLAMLAKFGFEVGYDGSIPGTQDWPDHGRGNHAHIEWVGNGTAADARKRFRDFLGGVGAAMAGGSAPAKSLPKTAPFKVKGGGTQAGGTIAPASGDVATAPLHFGPLPDNLAAVRKELALRRQQLWESRQALRSARAGKHSGVVRALEANISKLRQRIRQLRQQQVKLLVEKRIGRKGKLPKAEGAVAAAQRSYESLSEIAAQVMALEPEDAGAASAYVKAQETPAWEKVFGAVQTWRNAILGGEEGATKRLVGLQGRIKAIQALRDSNPKAWGKRRFEIPILQKAVNQIRRLFNPGPPPTGSLEESLTEVQGRDKSRERGSLPTEPVPGAYGGIVWDTQLQLRELGIKLKQAVESGSDNSERSSLLEELLRQANQRTAASEAAFDVLSGFDQSYPPSGGVFHSGGTVPGPASAEKLALVRGQERIRTPEQEIAMAQGIRGLGGGGGDLVIEQLIVNADGSVTAKVAGKEIKGLVREVIREDSALRLR
jgi:hypothetical protein